MKRKVTYFFLCLMLILSLESCSLQSKETSLEDNPSAIPVVDFLNITELTNSEKIYEGQLDFFIENKTDSCVVFPHDYGVEIYAKIENNWLQIPYLGRYMSETTITLTPNFGDYPGNIIHVLPNYSVLDERPKRIRVLVRANLCQNGIPSDEMVADYIDIDLENR